MNPDRELKMPNQRPATRPAFLALLVSITAAKLALSTVLGGSQQVLELRAQAEAFLEGNDLYDPRQTARSPSFFLLGNHVIAAGCLLLSKAARIPFVVAIKWPAILADLCIALVLDRADRGRAALLYILSPVTLLLSIYHGQLHTVALLGCVAALRLEELGRYTSSGVALALATSVRQHFAALLPTLALGRVGIRVRLLLGFAIVFATFSVPLLFMSSCIHCAAVPALNYGAWGYDMLLLQGPRLLAVAGLPQAAEATQSINRTLGTHANVIALVWPVVYGIAALWRRPANPWRAAFAYILGLYVFTPGVAVQWLVWAVPFFLLFEPRWGTVYNVLAGAFIVGSYWKWSLNARHGIYRLTRHLDVLSGTELAGVVLLGMLGLLIWGLCAWMLARHFGR